MFKRHFLPPCILAIGLGATETGLSCQYLITHDAQLPSGIVPIGYATAGMEVLLLDQSENGMGEIAVRSEYLAPGYWKRPDLTAKAFTFDPPDNCTRIYRTGDLGRRQPDGCIEYLGRKDFQLKVRGNRVEPAEVESALVHLPDIQQAVVTTRADSRGDARLIAYLVCAREPAPSSLMLRTELAKLLPEYMVPARFVFLDSLPLNENGKIDRISLQSLDGALERSTPVEPPRTQIEQELLKMWEEELGVAPLGVTDNFFECGGDSLSAMRILAHIEETYGRSLPLWLFVEARNVEQLAWLIAAKEPSPHNSILVPIQARGTKPPLFCVHDQNGEVFRFVALSRLLRDAQPVMA
jgi:acyl carrier protein